MQHRQHDVSDRTALTESPFTHHSCEVCLLPPGQHKQQGVGMTTYETQEVSTGSTGRNTCWTALAQTVYSQGMAVSNNRAPMHR
jgi:hypothetical protein